MTAAAVVLVVAVVLIVLALVYYLVSVIFALQKIAIGLDETIAAVGEIVEKTTPVKPVVDDINANLDAAVSALEGLLVKKAGIQDAMGLVEGLYPGVGPAGAPPPGGAAGASRPSPEAGGGRPRGGREMTRGAPPTRSRLGREAP